MEKEIVLVCQVSDEEGVTQGCGTSDRIKK